MIRRMLRYEIFWNYPAKWKGPFGSVRPRDRMQQLVAAKMVRGTEEVIFTLELVQNMSLSGPIKKKVIHQVEPPQYIFFR
jgi:hypothetical protein